MEIMDKGLTVPKWVVIVPKISQSLWPSQNIWTLIEKWGQTVSKHKRVKWWFNKLTFNLKVAWRIPLSRTTDANWSLYLMISQAFGPNGQIGRINFGVSSEVFSAKLSPPILALWVACPWFLSFDCFFLQKTLLFRKPKYDFGQKCFGK